ncbi:class I SAM-dependent methyltransferase [Desulfobacula sp.]|uniref:class I SAM-dependent methyltransferase n=1 Tax=Desulfobacula sp. TaxID=2593537 RepID=UPI001EC6E9CA|nr:class I SAM-dependent methyltransferase [Desulfobacula sp.]
MPVTESNQKQQTIYQRQQYAKGGLGRRHWDKRDQTALNLVRPSDLTIVDIGCGEGITLEKMHRLFPERKVFGIDFLSENIDICRHHGCKVEQGDVYNLQLSSKSVDFVLFMEVIEHLEDPETAIQEIYRVLAPGGRLVIVFPNDRFFKIARILTLRFREAAYDPGHVRQWTPYDMRSFLSEQGFTVAFSQNMPFYFWPVSLHCIMAADKNS